MAAEIGGNKKACVIGGTGFVASVLIKLLLEKGYAVNTTVRDPELMDRALKLELFVDLLFYIGANNQKRVSHLNELQQLGVLKIFRADLTDESSFDAPIAGCVFVFHVATPASKDPENDMIKPAMQGVLNVIRACARAKAVKRLVWTSSTAAVSINNLQGTGLVMDEKNWTDVEFLTSVKPPDWGYPASKMLAEKAAWRFAEENDVDLITVISTLLAGRSLTQDVPSSVCLAMSLITGNLFWINGLKDMQMLSGSIFITHVEDACCAHIFVAENESASGRYICCAANTCLPELAKFLNKIPRYKFWGFPSKGKLILSSEKLINEGFTYKYRIDSIYDQSVEYFKEKGLLQV
ncbi:hypothetical protein EUGRSUZ_D00700 [Eucalyptus grandis]|uniref:Uncharacterized protein n=2 Tax=Eucalyptus grandis TaxID=71139 RepID=A0ACC3L5F4_EUCGR|nr:hypothetical protein EUGRSUZ_D00700 [Eucalyptus grandis]